MISTKVSKGGTYTFTILAESGWKIHSVTFNETDVTGDLNPDNTYTTPKITENSTLTIIYEQDGSTVDAVKSSKVNIHATNRGICVNGVDVDDTIQVFTLDGCDVVVVANKTSGAQLVDVAIELGHSPIKRYAV